MRFKRKLVRLHLYNAEPSVEGILIERPANGFYRLAKSSMIVSEGSSIETGEAWVPRENVMFLQVLGE